MTAEIYIDSQAFASSIMAEFNRVKIPCQAAMAEAVMETTRNNFGQSGEDRPVEWEALKDSRYAKKVGRDYATLNLNGELESSITFDGSNADAAVVYCDNEPVYATAHQYGEGRMPERPFFPIVPMSNELTPTMQAKCLDVCDRTLTELLK
jgi:phage gpG-like protein